jgi:hypothetical protein
MWINCCTCFKAASRDLILDSHGIAKGSKAAIYTSTTNTLMRAMKDNEVKEPGAFEQVRTVGNTLGSVACFRAFGIRSYVHRENVDQILLFVLSYCGCSGARPMIRSEKMIMRSVDLTQPTVVIYDVSGKPPKSVSNFLFSGCRMFPYVLVCSGQAPVILFV